MSDFQTEYQLPNNGKLIVTAKGGKLSTLVDTGTEKFYETSTALPNHKDIVQSLGPKDRLKKGDMICIKYSNAPGYMEIVEEAKYDDKTGKLLSLTAKVPSGEVKTRNHLIEKSTYDSGTASFSYNETWVVGKNDMSFEIIRPKGKGTVTTISSPNPEPTPSQGGQANRRETPVQIRERELLQALDAKTKLAERTYSALHSDVDYRIKETAKLNPKSKFPHFWSSIGHGKEYDAMTETWRKTGQKEFSTWSQRQEELVKEKTGFDERMKDLKPADKIKFLDSTLQFYSERRSQWDI